MTLARAIRYLLAFASVLIVVWAFVHVGARIARKQGSSKIELTIMHWGDPDEDKILDTLVYEYQQTHPNIHISRFNPGNDFSTTYSERNTLANINFVTRSFVRNPPTQSKTQPGFSQIRRLSITRPSLSSSCNQKCW